MVKVERRIVADIYACNFYNLMYTMMFSIPVHEKPEVIIDQVMNFKFFNPNAGIVLHLSRTFDFEKSKISKDCFFETLKALEYVYVNPISVRTGIYDIIQAHLSNFHYISQMVEFKYFCLSASNELFIKSGLEKYLCEYDCGVGYGVAFEYGSNETVKWMQLNAARKDPALEGILKDISSNMIIGSQVEGTFYLYSVFNKITNIIDKNYNYLEMPFPYAREEVYFSTIVWGDDYGLKIKKNGFFTWVPWKRRYTVNVRIKEIKKLVQRNNQFYCVKRVPREINDCVRAYLRQTNGYLNHEKVYLGNLVKEYSTFSLKKMQLIKELCNYYKVSLKTIKVLRKRLGIQK